MRGLLHAHGSTRSRSRFNALTLTVQRAHAHGSTRSRSWFNALMIAYYVIVGIVAVAMYATVQDLIVDEIFHVPQLQEYCKNSLNYNNKITTPPGLYVTSWLWFKLLNSLLNWECTLGLARGTNVTYGIMMPVIIQKILKDWDVAVESSLFPPSFFFHFVYYTDSGSVFWVLCSFLEAQRKRYTIAAVYSFISIWYRQTNVIWMLFILGYSVAMMQMDRRKSGIISYIQFITNNPILIIQKLWGFVMNGILFAYFLYWNEGIVIGDKMNHTVAIHIPQIYYFSVFALFFSWDYQLVFKAIKTIRPIDFVLMIVMTWTVLEYTIEHPFLLADNRHFSFYIWRWFFKGNTTMRVLVVPLYFLALKGMFIKMRQAVDIVIMVGYSLAVILTLVPTPLLEFRYFITPYYFYRILTFKKGESTQGKTVLNIIVNAIVFWLFFFKTFKAASGEEQRFMW